MPDGRGDKNSKCSVSGDSFVNCSEKKEKEIEFGNNNSVYNNFIEDKLQTGYSKEERNPRIKLHPLNCITRPDHNTGNFVPYSLREVRGFFNVPC